jgi:hypothetical protein
LINFYSTNSFLNRWLFAQIQKFVRAKAVVLGNAASLSSAAPPHSQLGTCRPLSVPTKRWDARLKLFAYRSSLSMLVYMELYSWTYEELRALIKAPLDRAPLSST